MKSPYGKYRAVIFDMDGLLLDTERIALETFREACTTYGYEPATEVYFECIGTNAARTRQILLDGYGQDFPFDCISRVWAEKYETAVFHNPIPLKFGAMGFLQFVQKTGSKMAVATSTEYSKAVRKLQNTDLYDFFDVVVGGDQVEEGKPHPEIYLRASVLINEAPWRCLVLEDSDVGVLSAHRAGMTVIQIPDLKEPSPEIRKLGHPIFPSLEQLKKHLEGTKTG